MTEPSTQFLVSKGKSNPWYDPDQLRTLHEFDNTACSTDLPDGMYDRQPWPEPKQVSTWYTQMYMANVQLRSANKVLRMERDELKKRLKELEDGICNTK